MNEIKYATFRIGVLDENRVSIKDWGGSGELLNLKRDDFRERAVSVHVAFKCKQINC